MQAERAVPVWDLPTRLFHWSLVGCILAAWVTAEAEGAFFVLHLFFGEAVVGLVVFRVLWGFVGGRHARFSDFIRPPSAALAHLTAVFGRAPVGVQGLGHNPAAGWMVLALLAGSFVAAASGLFIAEDDFTGPFAGRFALDDDLHEGAANLLLFLVAVHVLAAFVMSALMGENLIRAMWTGAKRRPADFAVPPSGVPVAVAPWRAFAAAAVGAALALWPFL